jgi:integrase
MSCLRHIFSKAVEWELAEGNPFERGKSLHLKENNRRLRFLSEEEIQRLLAECPKHLRRIVDCALNTGMRKGEILSLKWSQVRNGFIYLQKTKTNEPREIPISDDLAELFREIRAEGQLRSDHVFTYWNGEDRLKGEKPVRERRKVAPVPKGG